MAMAMESMSVYVFTRYCRQPYLHIRLGTRVHQESTWILQDHT